jgi:hypothetical protein
MGINIQQRERLRDSWFLSTAGRDFDVECGHTVLGEQAWLPGNADEVKADMEPIFNLHQDHRFGLKSAIFERFGR